MKRTISLALGLGACVWPCLAQNASLGVPHAPLGAYEIAGGKSVDHIDVQRFRLSPGARGTRATFAANFGVEVITSEYERGSAVRSSDWLDRFVTATCNLHSAISSRRFHTCNS